MPNQPLSTWPPAYNLRLSRKARHAHLKVIPNKGLEVVIPVRLQKYFVVSDLLAEKKSWIEKHLAALTIKPLEYVRELHLHAINQTWHIEYKQTLSNNLRSIILPHAKQIVLYGNVEDIKHTHTWIQNWLKLQAREHLLPQLRSLSLQHQLPYNNAAVRAQKTLWGSCNYAKNISLNYKLLFLPPIQAQHIMLHELCHTKYLNHSKRFWSLLCQIDPNAEQHNALIRDSDKFVPFGF